jgi:signal transduction histidine kinase
VERDLHDGAQQRLVTASLTLRLARLGMSDESNAALRADLERASEEVQGALEELRELARGIHPAVLTEVGLCAAIKTLAERSALQVRVECGLDNRLAPMVEAAAYFVVSEALVNVAKHAPEARVTVRALRADGELRVDIEDDGPGGADAATGTGLRGLADRVAAVDGTLTVRSPRGGGTTVSAAIPVETVGESGQPGSPSSGAPR